VKTLSTVSAMLTLVLMPTLGIMQARAQDADDEVDTLVVASPADAHPRLQRRLAEFFKKLPEGTKVQVSVGQYFDQGQDSSTNQMQPYVASAVPVDAKERPHGEELHWRPRDHTPCRSVVWEKGRKNGLERLYKGWGKGRYGEVEVPWNSGRIDGVKKTYYAAGKLRNETAYKDGMADGPSKSYDADGKVTRVCTMKAGKREGRMTDYWSGTEDVKRAVDYRGGLVHGFMREFYANGQLKREIPFSKDLMHGEEKQLEADGTLTRSRFWLEGESVPPAVFNKQK